MGEGQGFANQTEKNIYSNLGVAKSGRIAWGCRWQKQQRAVQRPRLLRECSLSHANLFSAELPVDSAPWILYFPPLQVFTLKSHLFHVPSSSMALGTSVEECSGHTTTGPTPWESASAKLCLLTLPLVLAAEATKFAPANSQI